MAADYVRMSGSSVEAVIAWDVPATYGMPALYDDVDLKEQAQRTPHDLLHDVSETNRQSPSVWSGDTQATC
jgi:hypothetical protein